MLVIYRTLSLSLSIIIVCAIFYNAISNYVLNINNSLISSDPFNFQSRLEFLSSQMKEQEIASERLQVLESAADAGTLLEPLNARILSLLGAIKQRSDKDGAQVYYDRALSLERAERIALTQRYIHLIENQKYKEAIPIVELLFARWPLEFKKLRITLPLLLQTSENFEEVLSRFHSRLKGMTIIVGSILEYTDRIGLAYQFVLEAHDKYNVDVHDISRPITLKLIKQKRFSDAYLLFHKSLFEEEKENSGYIHNSSFRVEPTSLYFDWDIRPKAGVNLQRIPTRDAGSISSAQSKLGGLEIKFLNAPVAFSDVTQLLYLPKKKFQLSVKYSVDDFKGPSPISIKLECLSTRKNLAEVELSKLKIKEWTKTAIFEVPSTGCDMQKVVITNNNIVESWRNRFSGKVILHNISVKVLGS